MGSDSVLVESRLPCSDCGSSDALHKYSDGHTYCFSCRKLIPNDATITVESPPTLRTKKVLPLLPVGRVTSLAKRGLKQETCEKFGYFVTDYPEEFANGIYGTTKVQVAPYYDAEGRVVAQKVRFPDKTFRIHGDISKATLFGQNLARRGGKRIVITEGEIDAMSVAQAMKLSWPAVSIPNGAPGAKKAIQNNLEFLQTYDQVVLMFDMDEPGQAAAIECVDLFEPGQVAIASLPLKDPNEMLQEGRVGELVTAVWEAQIKRPDGIINGTDTWEFVSQPVPWGLPYPWKGLTDITYGLRPGEIVTLTAGTGIGKSAFCREIAYHLAMESNQKVGYVALEENIGRTAKGFVGLHLSKPIHLPGVDVPTEVKQRAFTETLGTGRFYFYDHFGSMDSDNLMSKLRYMVKGLGVKWIVLDHLSIVISGMDLDGDERRMIDRTMTMLRSFTEETQAGLILVSHLRRPPGGKAHEEGAQISLADLRGSAAIGQLSDIVIGLERNQQEATEADRNTTILRIIKHRFTGDTGLAAAVRYKKDTGRLYSRGFVVDTDGDVVFEPEAADVVANLSADAAPSGDF